MDSSQAKSPSISVIEDLDLWGLKCALLLTVLELELLDVIAGGQYTVAAIADTAHCSRRGVRILLDALCPLGLLQKTGGEYRLTPTSEAFLTRTGPAYCAQAYLTWWRSREKLAEAVRTGSPALDLTTPAAGGFWASFAASDLVTWAEIAGRAREGWRMLGVSPETFPAAQVLDIACGSAAKSYSLLQDDPDARVTAVDSPEVLAIATRVAEKMAVAPQVTFHPDDILTMEFPESAFDLVRFGAVLYFFNPDQVTSLLARANRALKPRGMVVISSLQADERRCETEAPLLNALDFFLASPYSEVYSFGEYKAFLEAAGFSNVTRHSDYLISAHR
jgi:SAM-dependent methyltransferase